MLFSLGLLEEKNIVIKIITKDIIKSNILIVMISMVLFLGL